MAIESGEHLLHLFEPTGLIQPSILLPCVHAERQTGLEHQRRVLAKVERAAHLPGLNRAGTHRVQYLQRWHQVTRRVKGDSELAVGEFGHALAHLFGGTVAGIETSGIERGHPPSNRRLRLGVSARSERCGSAQSARFQ